MSAEPHASPDRRPSADEAKAFTLAPMTPQAFGKYVLIGKLGHGGMAEVNLAVTGGKGGFRKLFVVKRLHAHLENEPGFIDMFLDEARLAAQLDHPHCVQTVEVGEANGQHFLAMEHLDGQGLERLLRMSASHGELIPPVLVARIVADALDGLGYAHELVGFDGTPLRVVHRDISPQNLFVTYTGVVKVLDFGIAKATSNVVETRTGVVKGKYAYIAPEQALATPIDHRADLWSMGVVFWELLTSRRLFKSSNELATLQETLRGDIRLPSEIVDGIPPELDEIAMRALQRDTHQRYPSAAAFRADLERYLAHAGAPSDRRAVAALMKQRFGQIIDIHRQKLRDCLETVAAGDQSIERLVAAGLTSSEHGAFTPGSVSLPPTANDGGTYTPSHIGPTPIAARASAPSVPAARSGAPSIPSLGVESHTDATMRVPPRASVRRLEPPPEQGRKRRAFGWGLVGAGVLLVAGVVVAVTVGPGLMPEEGLAPEPTTVTARVVGGAASEPVVDPATALPAVGTPGVAEPVDDARPRAGTSREGGRSGRSTRHGEHGARAESEEPETGAASAAAAADPPSGATTGEPSVVATTSEAVGSDADHGFLALATSPWTTVTWNGTSLGDTPLTRVRMPVGRHSLRLVNEAAGISETYEVEIRPGEVTRVRLGLR